MNELLYSNISLATIALAISAAALPKIRRRLRLSRAKHPSLAGHSRMAKRFARLIPGYSYDEAGFFGSDLAPADIQRARQRGFVRLATALQLRSPTSLALSSEAATYVPDMKFVARYRVPFQYSAYLNQHLRLSSFLTKAEGVMLEDLDGQRYFDLAGSYGVNVFGVDFYRSCLDEAAQCARALGPVLGAYHPVLADNVKRLAEISGLGSISFHMSGTEAVMQAVRLARYHTGKTHLVRFCGAYHGWWEDVQPGIGNPLPPRQTYTLADMSERSLNVLRTRNDIACVLVNPLQALHPNANAPGDSSLVDSGRSAKFEREAYSAWLQQLAQVCKERGIVFILDEVFLGFRLARGGAQAYFKVRADMVTYGKTLGGGLPVGVVCGRPELMQRYRDARPADICFARGTFNSHPYVMAAMNAFLQRIDNDAIGQIYEAADTVWNQRRDQFNLAMEHATLPVRATNLQSIWTLGYTQPSRYNWMLQFYLREQGLMLSWVGTGRLIFSLSYTDALFAEVLQRFVAAAQQMQADGWWHPSGQTNKLIRRSLLLEMLKRRRGGS